MKINQSLDSMNAGASSSKGLTSDKLESAGAKTPKVAPQTPAVENKAAGSSSIKLSNLSSKLQQIESQLSSGEAYDASRVAEIKQSISDGSFKVDSGNVADKLLAGARDLFVKHH